MSSMQDILQKLIAMKNDKVKKIVQDSKNKTKHLYEQ